MRPPAEMGLVRGVRVRTAARIAWGVAIVSFALIAAALGLLVLNRQAVDSADTADVNHLVSALAWTGLGALIASRRPQNRLGWLFLGTGVVFAVNLLSNHLALRALLAGGSALGWARWAAWLTTWLFILAFPTGLALLATLLLPDGRLPGKRWRWLAWTAVAYTVGLAALLAVDPTPMQVSPRLPELANPIGQPALAGFVRGPGGALAFLGGLLLLVMAFVALLRRLARSRGDERQQLKWIVYVIGMALAATLVAGVTALFAPDAATTAISVITLVGFGLALPVAFGVAILKYRLYDIDVVISRTLVYGSLAAFITSMYVAIVVGIGSVIGQGGKPNLGLSILATAVVAVGFQPARERVQKVANRLVYGKRATPYEVLSEFSERVAGAYAGAEVLPRMARVLAEGTSADRAEVWLRSGDRLQPAAVWPAAGTSAQALQVSGQTLPHIPGVDLAAPVLHQGELLGALSVTKRKGESLTPIEEELLHHLANQAGLVLKNVGLTADLQYRLEELRASRQRLVAAQDEERRRLERNLHDGAQQNLVALKVKLGLAEMFAVKDPARARLTLAELKADTDEALETLRDLARGIYPPLLAHRGLREALESRVRKAAVAVEVRADGIGRYSQDVEAAVYFCVLEALQNVQKYAGATKTMVRLFELEHRLQFEVLDNGRGFDTARAARGAGLTNMEDRLDALGGELTVASEEGSFTRVSGSLPLEVALPA